MTSVADVEEQMKFILEERANVLAEETGCIKRVRKFHGADVVQMLVFGWQAHPEASLENLASMAAVRDVLVSDTAVDKRFTPECARFLHRVVEEMSQVVVQAAHDVPVALLRRFRAVILQDSSTITLPDALAEIWRVLCELYAKLIGWLIQHWLIVLFAWQDPQRSLVKLAQVVRDTGWSIMEALAGGRSLPSAFRLIQRRMRSGCQMNERKKHPNSAQLLEREAVDWALSWCE